MKKICIKIYDYIMAAIVTFFVLLFCASGRDLAIDDFNIKITWEIVGILVSYVIYIISDIVLLLLLSKWSMLGFLSVLLTVIVCGGAYPFGYFVWDKLPRWVKNLVIGLIVVLTGGGYWAARGSVRLIESVWGRNSLVFYIDIAITLGLVALIVIQGFVSSKKKAINEGRNEEKSKIK